MRNGKYYYKLNSGKGYIQLGVLIFSMFTPFLASNILKKYESAGIVCWGSLIFCLIYIAIMIFCIIFAILNDSQALITTLFGVGLLFILAIVFVPYVEDLHDALADHYTITVGTLREVYVSGTRGGYRYGIVTKNGLLTQKMGAFKIGDQIKVEYLPHSRLVNHVEKIK